jgi:hypothetical protein
MAAPPAVKPRIPVTVMSAAFRPGGWTAEAYGQHHSSAARSGEI